LATRRSRASTHKNNQVTHARISLVRRFACRFSNSVDQTSYSRAFVWAGLNAHGCSVTNNTRTELYYEKRTFCAFYTVIRWTVIPVSGQRHLPNYPPGNCSVWTSKVMQSAMLF